MNAAVPWVAGLLLVLVTCEDETDPAPPPPPECDAAPDQPIGISDDCWDDTECTLDTETERTCGRAYRCPIEQIGGTYKDVCVVAVDCDCVDELEACGIETDDLPHCDFGEGG